MKDNNSKMMMLLRERTKEEEEEVDIEEGVLEEDLDSQMGEIKMRVNHSEEDTTMIDPKLIDLKMTDL